MGKMRLVQRQRLSLKQKICLRLKINISQRQIMTPKGLAICSMGLVMGVFSIIAILNIGSTKDSFAGGTTKFTMQDGEWSAHIWTNTSGGATCNCDPGNNYNGPGININHIITSTVYNPLKISGGGTVNISASGKLDITGNFELNGASTINIQNSDSVIVNGDLTVSGGSVINSGNSGYLQVRGNVTLSGGSKVVGPAGRVNATGSVSGTGWQSATLPIQLNFFRAKTEEGSVELYWSTASERNNDFFTVERSSDGKIFDEVLKSSGAGNSTVALSYTASDNDPLNGVSYYRLKQTDIDGNYTYSMILSVSNKGGKTEDIVIESVSPNPFTKNFTLNYVVATKGIADVMLFNNAGICIYRESMPAEKGHNQIFFNDSTDLPIGIYYVKLFFNGRNAMKKVMKS